MPPAAAGSSRARRSASRSTWTRTRSPGAEKGPLDSGATPRWDVGGVSGAELIGSTFTVTFEDGTTATGQLQGVANTQTSNSQGGAIALATQRAHAGTVTLNVDGLVPAARHLRNRRPAGHRRGPAGETARVVLAKGFLQPGEINSSANPMPVAARRPARCARSDAVPGQQRRRNPGARRAADRQPAGHHRRSSTSPGCRSPTSPTPIGCRSDSWRASSTRPGQACRRGRSASRST